MNHSLEQKIENYRKIRKLVWNESTSGILENQKKLREKITTVTESSNLYRSWNADPTKIWEHLWQKVRYAGIKADSATKVINDIKPFFNDYNSLASETWNNGGELLEAYLNHSGCFASLKINRHSFKLECTLELARKYKSHINEDKPPISFIVDDQFNSSLSTQRDLIKYFTENQYTRMWKVFYTFKKRYWGKNSGVTTFHLLMDLGFPVIKPDIVISRLFYGLGWLETGPCISGDFSKYTHLENTKPIIELAQEIVANVSTEDLENDIGWVTENPIREFDIFMVKFGQEPETGWGLDKKLFRSNDDLKRLLHL